VSRWSAPARATGYPAPGGQFGDRRTRRPCRAIRMGPFRTHAPVLAGPDTRGGTRPSDRVGRPPPSTLELRSRAKWLLSPSLTTGLIVAISMLDRGGAGRGFHFGPCPFGYLGACGRFRGHCGRFGRFRRPRPGGDARRWAGWPAPGSDSDTCKRFTDKAPRSGWPHRGPGRNPVVWAGPKPRPSVRVTSPGRAWCSHVGEQGEPDRGRLGVLGHVGQRLMRRCAAGATSGIRREAGQSTKQAREGTGGWDLDRGRNAGRADQRYGKDSKQSTAQHGKHPAAPGPARRNPTEAGEAFGQGSPRASRGVAACGRLPGGQPAGSSRGRDFGRALAAGVTDPGEPLGQGVVDLTGPSAPLVQDHGPPWPGCRCWCRPGHSRPAWLELWACAPLTSCQCQLSRRVIMLVVVTGSSPGREAHRASHVGRAITAKIGRPGPREVPLPWMPGAGMGCRAATLEGWKPPRAQARQTTKASAGPAETRRKWAGAGVRGEGRTRDPGAPGSPGDPRDELPPKEPPHGHRGAGAHRPRRG